MYPRTLTLLVGLATSLMAAVASEAPPVTTDRPLSVQAKLGAAQAMFQSQLPVPIPVPVSKPA